LKAADLVGVEPGLCWVIEDSLQGIAAGQSAGMRVVGISTSHTPAELAHTDVVRPDFANLFDTLLNCN
jgi:beta-phosphoglucomutase-like phosphatase (HAD superfamily)